MTKEQFENLDINDYIYYYSFNSNTILKNKITAKYNNTYYDDTILYIIKNDYGEREINFNSIVFLTEKECLQYYINNGYRKELSEEYAEKYVEYFI